VKRIEAIAEQRRRERIERGEPEPPDDPEPVLPILQAARPSPSPGLLELLRAIDEQSVEMDGPPSEASVLDVLTSSSDRSRRRTLREGFDRGLVRRDVVRNEWGRILRKGLVLTSAGWELLRGEE